MTDEQRSKLRWRVARHKAILESMDPEYVARVRAKAGVCNGTTHQHDGQMGTSATADGIGHRSQLSGASESIRRA